MISVNGCELCECNDPCEKAKCDANQDCVLENAVPVCRASKIAYTYYFFPNF